MLVQINTEVGGHSTDHKTRFYNFLCCLHAVATAPANSSPVVNPVNTSGVRSTSNNCITVLSNVEGGGWLTGANNNTNANTTYNSANTGSQIIDLYAPTGKSTAPYYRMAFGNFQYSFSNAMFTLANSECEFAVGHTSSNIDPSANTLVQDTAFWTNGTTSTGRNPRTVNNSTLALGGLSIWIGATGVIWTVACTSNYLIIMSSNKEVFYFGIRSVSPWETTINSNPPWVSFGWGRAPSSFNYYQAWVAPFSANGSSSTTASKYGSASINVTHFLTSTGSSATLQPVKNDLLYAATAPLTWYTAAGGVRWDTPTVDPVSGLASPTATPLTMYMSSSSGASASGVLPGILRGPSTTSEAANTWILYDDYTINGTEYRTVRQNEPTSCEIFFLKKA